MVGLIVIKDGRNTKKYKKGKRLWVLKEKITL